MAKTTASKKGRQKKIVPVKGYKRNGKRVSAHRRTTPN